MGVAGFSKTINHRNYADMLLRMKLCKLCSKIIPASNCRQTRHRCYSRLKSTESCVERVKGMSLGFADGNYKSHIHQKQPWFRKIKLVWHETKSTVIMKQGTHKVLSRYGPTRNFCTFSFVEYIASHLMAIGSAT